GCTPLANETRPLGLGGLVRKFATFTAAIGTAMVGELVPHEHEAPWASDEVGAGAQDLRLPGRDLTFFVAGGGSGVAGASPAEGHDVLVSVIMLDDGVHVIQARELEPRGGTGPDDEALQAELVDQPGFAAGHQQPGAAGTGFGVRGGGFVGG